ncbi:MAG TPA: flagellar basal body rod C-terminal domain-containing protein [Sphingomonas sp.]|nr:flagellar basal body rod C-terminal domain-containing protein [Sphingomonas sp.]
MSISDILSSALSGLGAAQAGMRTVSNNIANVSTPGYARQTVSLNPGNSQGRTNGVVIGEPGRVADRFLENTAYARAGDVGKASVTSDYLERLQSLLGAPGSESSISARLDAITTAATPLTGSNGSVQSAAVYVGAVADSLQGMQQLDSDLRSLRGDADAEIGDSIDRINSLLTSIGDLNDQVSRLQVLGRSTAGAADLRNGAIEQLGGLIGVVPRAQPDGSIALDTTSGVTLVDRQVRQLFYPSSGTATDQSTYPPIEVRMLGSDGQMGLATGDTIDTAAAGGRIGGLIALRDKQIPAFREQVGALFGGVAQALNGATNANTTVPAPNSLSGRATSLDASDRLGFTGSATFAITRADGTLNTKGTIDFSTLAPDTVQGAVDAINDKLGPAGTASFTDGKLTIKATAATDGVVVAQNATTPSDRAGVGFSQYFGLNDIVRSEGSTLTPSGFTDADAAGFGGSGEVVIAVRDTNGKLVASQKLDMSTAGTTFGAISNTLNNGALKPYGSFKLDDTGRLRFDPSQLGGGSSVSVLSDNTDRAGTGISYSSIVGLTGMQSGLLRARVDTGIANRPELLPLARLQTVSGTGPVLGAADRSGANGLIDALGSDVNLGAHGVSPVSRYASSILGDAGTQAANAKSKSEEATARHDDAVARRDNYSGVSLDEELSQLVILQKSYSASARIVSTATEMYDTLIAMMR